MRRTRIKICGITRAEDLDTAVKAGADAIGVVLYQDSPRGITIDAADELLCSIPAFVSVVSLFVDAEETYVREAIARLPLSCLQFHGSENAAWCAQFGKPWMKALRVAPETDIARDASPFAGASGLLLDAYKPGVPGGTGERFDWARVPASLPAPLVMAGGLRADNVGELIRSVQPYAVDVSGGVEDAPGLKSARRIQEFVDAVKAADTALA